MRSVAGQPVVVTATPLPCEAFRTWEVIDRDAAVLIQVYDPGASARAAAPALLRALYDLTEAEVRVASAIAAGLSTPAVAAELHVSVNTVRTHLSRCFDKTGTRSQAGLMRLLANLPAL